MWGAQRSAPSPGYLPVEAICASIREGYLQRVPPSVPKAQTSSFLFSSLPGSAACPQQFSLLRSTTECETAGSGVYPQRSRGVRTRNLGKCMLRPDPQTIPHPTSLTVTHKQSPPPHP
eukprot:2432119-Rhodomonas_salina.2